MKELRDLLPKAVGRKSIVDAALAQAVLRDWDEIVGPLLAAHIQPDSFKGGVVWVTSEHSAFLQELIFHRATLIERLNARAERPGLFKDIRASRAKYNKFTPES